MARNVDLLEGSIVGSLTSLALPIMATSLIQMAYNMTDMIWIGRFLPTRWRQWGRRRDVSVAGQRAGHDPPPGGQVKVAHELGRRPRSAPLVTARRPSIWRAAGHPVYRHVHPPPNGPLIAF